MNIWCISKYASTPKQGFAARIFYLAKEFAKDGHNSLLIMSDSNHLAKFPHTEKEYNFDNVDGVNVIWTKNIKYNLTASIRRVISWFDFEASLFRLDRKHLPRPDVIIVSSLSLLSIFYGYYLKRKYKAVLVFEVRDIWPLTLIAEGGFNKYHPLCIFLSFVEKFGYKKADLIVGTMPKLDEHIRKTLGYERPFFCSPLGFDPAVMSSRLENKDFNFVSSFPKDKFIIGYAGSMGISNNLDSFIDAIQQMSTHLDIHFVLVGAGDKREEFELKISTQENVTFLPRIPPEQVPIFLDNCDLLYLSTHDSEVWDYGQSMNKVVEYMYAGKPVVASYSGYPSMLNEAGSGFFVPPNNSRALSDTFLKVFSKSKGDRNEMGAKGKAWIKENRTYNKLAQEYLSELRSLVKSN